MDEPWKSEIFKRYGHWPQFKKLEPIKGNGDPGTVYSAGQFHQATTKHGRAFGPFEQGRVIPYEAKRAASEE
jgi:hypothetical protein